MILAAQLGSPVAPEAATLDQLTTIAALLSGNDIAGLRAFIEANPDLLEGDTPLAILLRRFMLESADPMVYLAFDPTLQTLFESLAGGISTDAEPIEEGSDLDDDGTDDGGGPGGGGPGDDGPY